MLSSYMSTAFRALTKHKLHLFLNLFGLAVGLAAALLIARYTIHESSYDDFQPAVESTFLVVQRHKEADVYHPLTSPALHGDIKASAGVADVMDLVGADSKIDGVVRLGADVMKLKDVYGATANIRSFISLNVLHGDLARTLSKPDEIALSKSEAIRFFGEQNAVGKTLQTERKAWQVSAVFDDLPENTHFGFKALVSATQFRPAIQRYDSYTYVRLKDGADVAAAASEIGEALNNKTHQGKSVVEVFLQPVTDIHLSDLYGFRMTPPGSKRTVSIAIALSLILLLIASFSFINLSTAQAGLRATEVGVRKSLGASRVQLMVQFLTESLIVATIAALIACALAEIALPYFNDLVERRLTIEYLGEFGLVVIGATLFVGLLAGLYPALFLSSFSAKRTLSGDLQRGLTAIWIRKALLATQAALSIGLIVGAATLWFQLKHLNEISLGYQKENRLIVSTIEQEEVPFLLQDDTLFGDIGRIEGVESMTITDLDPTTAANASVRLRSSAAGGAPENIAYAGVGFDAAAALGLKLLSGRDFSASHRGDWFTRDGDKSQLGVIITESMLPIAGFKSADEAIDKEIIFDGGPLSGVAGRVVGVVANVKLGGSRDVVVPTIFGCGLSWTGTSSIYVEVEDVGSASVAQAIRDILRVRLHMPIVEVDSVESRYAALYRGERQQAKVILVFSMLVVFLTCVGLFGMASFSTQRRGREVAIRRVMGASRISLVNLLASEYIVLSVASVLIAFPLTYWLLGDWLSNFNDRIEQSPLVYLSSAILVAVITWATVSLVAYRVASLSPASMLKHD